MIFKNFIKDPKTITPINNQLIIDIDYYDIMNTKVDENTIKFCYDTDYVIPKF